nr:PAS domain S-box protein [Candidatus Delongbacteria bacterium]
MKDRNRSILFTLMPEPMIMVRALILLLIMINGTIASQIKDSLVSSSRFIGRSLPDAVPCVLYVNSYHPGYLWSDNVQAGIRQVMTRAYRENMDLRIEYLDGKRYSSSINDRLGEAITAVWKAKYYDVRFDLIMVSDQDAYNFVSRIRDHLFPGVPLVFSGVEDPGKISSTTTGVLPAKNYQKNIETILYVLPNTYKIWIITDPSTTGRINRREISRFFSYYSGRVEFGFFDDGSGLETDSLLSMVSRLKAGDVIYFMDFFYSRSGRYIDIKTFLPQLTARSPVPVFSHVDAYLEFGVTGGNMNSGLLQGQQLAELSLKILHGNSVTQCPPEIEHSQPVFDYPALERYGIPLSVLPPDSRIVRPPIPGFWDQYRHYALILIVFIILEGTLIAGLVMLVHRQRILKREAEQNALQFKAFFDLAPYGCQITDMQGRLMMVNQAFCSMVGYDQSACLGHTAEELGMIKDCPEWDRLVYEVHRNGECFNREIRILTRDGHIKVVLVSSRIIAMGINQVILNLTVDITPLKQAEDQLSFNHAVLAAQQELTLDGILVVDPQSRMISWNQRFVQMWSIPPDVMETRSDRRAVDSVADQVKDYDGFLKSVEQIYQDNQAVRHDELILKDGRIFDRNTAPMIGKDGTYYGRVWFFRDITQRKQVEKSLRESERRFKQLFDQAPIPFSYALYDGRIAGINKRMTEEMGYTLQDIPTLDHWWDLAYPEPRYRNKVKTLWNQAVEKAMATGDDIQAEEYQVTCKDGHVKTMLIFGILIDDGLLACFFDITERLQAERALQRREQLLQSRNESLQNLLINGQLFLNDFENAVAEITRLGSRLLGTDRVSVWIYSDDYSTLRCISLYEMSTQSHSSGEELRSADFPTYAFAHREGKLISVKDVNTDPRTRDIPESYLKYHDIHSLLDVPIWFGQRVRGVLSFEATGLQRAWTREEEALATSLATFVTLGFEIDERKRSENEREKLTNQLLQSQKLESIGQLAGGIAHDFNNMLAVILGQTEMAMLTIQPSDPFYHPFQEIRKAAESSSRMTAQLLAFARKQAVTLQIVDLNEMVDGMITMLKRLIGVNIILNWIPFPAVCLIRIDPTQIDQILVNLCVNA